MKSRTFVIVIIIVFIIEASLTALFLRKAQTIEQDNVMINDCLKTVEENYGNVSKYPDDLSYSIIDNDGNVIYTNGEDVSFTMSDAVRRNDTILDVMHDGELMGHMIFRNTIMDRINGWRLRIAVTVFVSSALQAILIISYYFYLRKTITEPFGKLSSFATRVAGGDLDVPLDLDKKHVFGSFTEAFDLMRTELKKSRASEKAANDAKKEMVAKLSHDIKTPVASIKSASEFGYELSKDEKIKERFNSINIKADELTVLVDNLFNSSVSDATEIQVNPRENNSQTIYDAIKNADYLQRVKEIKIPECKVFTDNLRIQQAFDNVFINSYKYADTAVKVTYEIAGDYLVIRIADEGPGVKEEELPLLKEKFRRGSNASDKDGAGLGLYLTDYFMEKMDGQLGLKNLEKGFEVSIYIRVV